MKAIITRTVSISSDYQKVFEFLADPMKQPEWAINFIKGVRPSPEGYVAQTPFGEHPIRIQSDVESGVIDIFIGDGVPSFTRLIKNDQGCEYVFTLAKPDSMPETAWHQYGIPGLEEELASLKSIFEKTMLTN